MGKYIGFSWTAASYDHGPGVASDPSIEAITPLSNSMEIASESSTSRFLASELACA